MITKFDTYNESVRDMMKPKSKEDIDASLVGLTPNQKFDKIYREYAEDILDFLSEEDYKELLHSLTPGKKLDVGCRDALAWLVKEALDEGVSGHELQNSIYVLDVENRDWESVSKIGKMLIKAGVDMDRGNLLMDEAANNGDAELLQMILDKRTLGPVGERIFRVMKTYRIIDGKMTMISEGDPKILKMFRDYRRKVRQSKTNESVRSFMKPKSVEDIKNDLLTYFDSLKITHIPKELKQFTFMDFNNTYEIIDYEDYYAIFNHYLGKLTRGKQSSSVTEKFIGTYRCYPEQKIIFCNGNDEMEQGSWYFDGSYIDELMDELIKYKSVTNESVKDMMKPK